MVRSKTLLYSFLCVYQLGKGSSTPALGSFLPGGIGSALALLPELEAGTTTSLTAVVVIAAGEPASNAEFDSAANAGALDTARFLLPCVPSTCRFPRSASFSSNPTSSLYDFSSPFGLQRTEVDSEAAFVGEGGSSRRASSLRG